MLSFVLAAIAGSALAPMAPAPHPIYDVAELQNFWNDNADQKERLYRDRYTVRFTVERVTINDRGCPILHGSGDGGTRLFAQHRPTQAARLKDATGTTVTVRGEVLGFGTFGVILFVE